jgi:N utilization substance protein B
MAVRQTERHLKRRRPGPTVIVSASEKRERARVRRNVVRSLEACADSLRQLTGEALTYPPRLTADDATARAPSATSAATRRLERALRISTLPRDDVADVRQVAGSALDAMLATIARRLPTACATAQMTAALAIGASRNREELDDRLRRFTGQWPSERQSAPDRNILRLAAFELLHCPDTPPAVALNEAVELAKRYGTEESGRFVNGVLSALAAEAGLICTSGRSSGDN